MTQTKKHSIIETITNVGSGYLISMVLNLTILPMFVIGIASHDFNTSIYIGVIYTGTSMVRSYFFRRWYNK